MRGPTVPHRLIAALAPLLALVLVLGCPRDHGTATTASSASGSVTSATSAPPSAGWPKVVAIPDPADAGAEPTPIDIEAIDADLDAEAADAADAAAADADARAKPDAYDDAPLMGAKTFPDENPMRGIRRITAAAARVRKAPKTGDIIATLPKGTEVSLVAEIFDWYRVRYNDPNTDVRRQGWIYVTTFAGPRMKTCPTGWTHHDQDGGWCDRECTKNTDCKALKGYKCSGTLCFYAAD
ncbi:MAG: SH3 domain-containing protein [Deltaproteobacteria bacterium]|nr:SH3 domain-containing protein [Deltaproteobacteria bacterium]